MKGLLITLSSTIVSSIFFWLGAQISMFTGIMFSMVGMGIGIYVGKKLVSEYMDL